MPTESMIEQKIQSLCFTVSGLVWEENSQPLCFKVSGLVLNKKFTVSMFKSK